jgi:hypothetical protein
LKKEQMFVLNGGGTKTDPGNICLETSSGVWRNYDYGYDAYRSDGSTTYHNRTITDTICEQPAQT